MSTEVLGEYLRVQSPSLMGKGILATGTMMKSCTELTVLRGPVPSLEACGQPRGLAGEKHFGLVSCRAPSSGSPRAKEPIVETIAGQSARQGSDKEGTFALICGTYLSETCYNNMYSSSN